MTCFWLKKLSYVLHNTGNYTYYQYVYARAYIHYLLNDFGPMAVKLVIFSDFYFIFHTITHFSGSQIHFIG